MAKEKNSGIDKLKKEKSLKPIDRKKMTQLVGGSNKRRRWRKGCGGIIPQ